MRTRTGVRTGHQVELLPILATVALLIGLWLPTIVMVRDQRWPETYFEWFALIGCGLSLVAVLGFFVVGLIRKKRG